MDLFEYYEKFGYHAIGYNDFLKYRLNKTQLSEKCYFFWLSWQIFNEKYCETQVQSEKWNNLIIKYLNEINKIDKLPQFMIIHSNANHLKNGQRLYWIDQYLSKLLKNIDLTQTIIHLTSDHGNMIGDSLTSLYGQWEQNNPISILLLPKKKFPSNNNPFKNILKYLKFNQQRMITHYDMHLFWKQIPLLFIKIKYLNKNWNKLSKIKWIYDTLPRVKNKNSYIKPARSIMNQYIENNRSCDEIENGYCFCDPLKGLNINDLSLNINTGLIENDKKYIYKAIDKINKLTGNGKFNCIKYEINNFNVISHIIRDNDNMIIISLQEKIGEKMKKFQFKKLRKENKILTFMITIKILNENDFEIISIERLDYFKYEQCLINFSYDNIIKNTFNFTMSYNEPIFKDYDMMKNLYKQTNIFNLRLCRCK